ncbi:MAG: hypothetical protein P0120_07030 [Nitrospira sp.]|nr:hypothetical protein [Nitrospira sp.]
MMKLDPKIPPGSLETKWDRRRFSEKLVSPNNKGKITVIAVAGLARASAASTLGQLGYQVECFCFHDSRAAPTVLRHRGDQRGKKLPRRRRQCRPTVL